MKTEAIGVGPQRFANGGEAVKSGYMGIYSKSAKQN